MHGKSFDPNSKFDMKVFKRILKYMAKYKYRYMFIFLCIIISAGVQAIGQLFLKTLIDDYITPLIGDPNPVYFGLLKFLGFVSLVYLIGLICTFLYNRIMVNVAQGVLKDIRDDLFNHMQTLPISYFDKNSYGDIMSRYTNDTDTLEQMVSQSMGAVVSSVITIITVFVSMLILNIPLTLVVVGGLIAMTSVTKGVVKKSGSYFGGQQKSLGELNGFIEEMIDGQKVIKVFTHEEKAKEDFVKLNEEWFINSSNANAYGNMIGPITNNIGHIIYVIIALIGGLIAIHTNTFTLGAIASFLFLTNSFTRPIMQITGQFNMIIRSMAGAGRIFELMDEPEEENTGTVRLVNVRKENDKLIEENYYTGLWAWKKDGELILLQGDIRLYNVSFGYNKNKEVIHDISLYAKPGQKIAFVGSTGAGKTTVSNLLNRFYDIDKGTITYDGIDIKEINKKDLRRSLGMVLQDTNLFTGTIMDNIRYGNLHASDEECINAAKLANADDFIRLLPDGYNTVISGNGSNLSQGERQLLAIARCAVANPPAMILDEATSSIDTRTEKIVQDGMDKLMKGRTVFVIAHRLSTIQNSKAILVMENGRIIERGGHEELIKEHGRYYELYTGKVELD
ncbi:MAG: ABC transporter ATP-binding protein [Bacilli bacterium]|nr:ABC transporter ATP-binding protein [Bacilli bacterium]